MLMIKAAWAPSLLVLGLLPLRPIAANQAFDPSGGVLSVDYAHYLAKHDVVFNSPIAESKQGMTVGNGRVGAMVWNANGLTLQVTGVDASPQTCFSEGWLNLATSPAMDANTAVFHQALVLYDGLINTRYDENRVVTIMGSPNSEVMGIHVEDKRTDVKTVTFQINMWDPNSAQLSGGGYNVPDITTWKTVTSLAEPAVAGINRGQADPNHFGYTLAATVEGTAFTTHQVDARTVRFDITPAASYTIWIACASRINAPGNNSVTQAKALLEGIRTVGYAKTLAAYKEWWHAFWAKSFVQYSNTAGDADYLENFYYLATYIIASGSYGKYPFHFVNGVYRWNADVDIHWSNAYWYWNMRDIYNSMLTSNHPEAMDGFFRLYSSTLPRVKTFTQSRFNIDGAWIPETMGWDGDASGTTESEFTKLIWTTGAEVSSNMFNRFEYTNDSAFLKTTAYPVMRETAKFLQSKFTFDAGANQYYMGLSNAHETYWKVKNAITDLAAVHFQFPNTIKTAKALNLDPDLQAKLQTTLDKVVPYKTEDYDGGNRYLPYDPPEVPLGNGENITCELIWPYSVTGIGASDYSTALNSWKSRMFPYGAIWANDAIQAARLGLGDETFDGMRIMLAKYQSYANGFTDNTNSVFEFIGVHIQAMNEAMLQSHNDTLRVFPAAPNTPGFTGKFTLAAKGGFLVSSEKEAGEIKYVGIKSQYGRPAVIVNPWGTEPAQVRKVSGAVVATSSGSILSFNTVAGGIYVLERTARGLSAYAFAQLTGIGNGSAKTLVYANKTMSLGSGQGKPEPVNLSPMRQIAATPSRIQLVSGGRLSFPAMGDAKEYAVEFYSLSGKRIKEMRVDRRFLELRRDAGICLDVCIARVSPIIR